MLHFTILVVFAPYFSWEIPIFAHFLPPIFAKNCPYSPLYLSILAPYQNVVSMVYHVLHVPNLQEEFIRQYKYIEDLMQRCYPGAQICLDFTMTDILEYFSGIAMHH